MPTLNDVLAGSQAQAVQVQQIIDALKGTPNKGVPVALVSLNDPSNYALTVQNDDPVNSRALSVLKADGTTLISADATGVTLGAPLNVPAGALNGTQLANASVSNAKLGPDVARASLLVNGGFEIWQRGNGPFTATAAYAADRWQISLSGSDTLSVSRDTTNVDNSLAAAALVFVLGTGAGATVFQQAFGRPGDALEQLKNKTVSFSIRVRTSTATSIRAYVSPDAGVTKTFSNYHSGGGTYETLTVSLALGAATDIRVGVACAASCTAYLDNAMLVVGSQPCDYVPLHPADDLARCQRYYELLADPASGALQVGASGTVSAGGVTARAWWAYKTRKAVNPTITIVPTWTTSNSSALSVGQQDSYGVRVFCTSVAAGDFYVFNSGAGATMSVEANP